VRVANNLLSSTLGSRPFRCVPSTPPAADASLGSASVSVVLPTYNEGGQPSPLPGFPRRTVSRCSSMSADLIVVDDGSEPRSAATHRRAVDEANGAVAKVSAPRALPVHAANQGKGSAIRLGWDSCGPEQAWLGSSTQTGGRRRGVLETGQRAAPNTGRRALRLENPGCRGRSVNRSLFRHLQARAFAATVSTALQPGILRPSVRCEVLSIGVAAARLLQPEREVAGCWMSRC